MYKICLKENEDKLETFVDFEEIVAFNERCIHFKCGKSIDSCKEWHEQLKNFSNRLIKYCSVHEEVKK